MLQPEQDNFDLAEQETRHNLPAVEQILFQRRECREGILQDTNYLGS